MDKPQLIDILKMIAANVGFELPEWIDEFFEYLIKNDQLILFTEDGKITGYMCYWRYGENRKAWIKECGYKLKKNYKQMTKGKYVYIPLWVCSRNDDKFTKKISNVIKNRIDGIKSISVHDSDGEFHVCELKKEA